MGVNFNDGNSGMYELNEKVAVAIAVGKKTITAVNERTDSLGNPHNPCPLVHPFESSVPAPTNAPAIIRWVLDVDKVSSILSKGKVANFLY